MALTKKALVVGDRKQLEPVWDIEEKVDRGERTQAPADNL